MQKRLTTAFAIVYTGLTVRNGIKRHEVTKMKFTVKYRENKHCAFANVGSLCKATRGKFKGTLIFRDRIFCTREEAEHVLKEYAEKYGVENVKIAERR